MPQVIETIIAGPKVWPAIKVNIPVEVPEEIGRICKFTAYQFFGDVLYNCEEMEDG